MQTNGFIQFSNVEVLKNQISVLKNLTFNIPKGDFVYLLDPSGQHKTAVIQTIYGQRPIKHGHAMVADIPLHNINQQAIPYLRRQLGLVSPDFPLNYQLSVEENLQLVLVATDWTDQSAQKNRIQQLLDYLEISTLRKNSPRDLTTTQQALVLIARALLNNPAVLMVDYPLQQLDNTAESYVRNKIYAYAQEHDTTVLWWTNMSQEATSWQKADKVFAFHNHHITEVD